MATVIESRVTPFAVAPPLSPDQNGTHGGDCGSSICRGGSPTHRRTRATSIDSREVVVDGASVSQLPCVSQTPALSVRPDPVSPAWGCMICSTAWGANSAMVGGGVCREVNATTPMRTTSTALSTTYTKPGDRGREPDAARRGLLVCRA